MGQGEKLSPWALESPGWGGSATASPRSSSFLLGTGESLEEAGMLFPWDFGILPGSLCHGQVGPVLEWELVSSSSLDQTLIPRVLQQIGGGWWDFFPSPKGIAEERGAGKELFVFSGTRSVLEGGRAQGKHFLHFPFEDDVGFQM